MLPSCRWGQTILGVQNGHRKWPEASIFFYGLKPNVLMSISPYRFKKTQPVGEHAWDAKITKWNGNLYGKRNGVKVDLSFPKHPECESFDARMFGEPSMSSAENKDVGFVSSAPDRPADYVSTVLSTSMIEGDDDSDMEEQTDCVDFDSDWQCTLLRRILLPPMPLTLAQL